MVEGVKGGYFVQSGTRGRGHTSLHTTLPNTTKEQY